MHDVFHRWRKKIKLFPLQGMPGSVMLSDKNAVGITLSTMLYFISSAGGFLLP